MHQNQNLVYFQNYIQGICKQFTVNQTSGYSYLSVSKQFNPLINLIFIKMF